MADKSCGKKIKLKSSVLLTIFGQERGIKCLKEGGGVKSSLTSPPPHIHIIASGVMDSGYHSSNSKSTQLANYMPLTMRGEGTIIERDRDMQRNAGVRLKGNI